MTTVSQLWKGQKGNSPVRKFHAMAEMVLSRKVGDPLLKKLDYTLM